MTHTETTRHHVRSQLGHAVHQNPALSRTGIEERLFSRLFTGLVYAQIWEDPAVDIAGLSLTSGDRIACISSGGCNLLSYLPTEPASITAVDLSPAHVALVRLKLAAARHLPDHAAFYDLFGHADRPGNAALFDRHLAPHLDTATRDWWQARDWRGRRRVAMLGSGLYRHGALGRFISAMHLVLRVTRVDTEAFLGCRTLGEQRTYFDTRVAPLFDKALVRWLCRRPAVLFGLGIPPAQYERLAADGDGDGIVSVLRERTRKLMCDFPLSENYFAWAAFNRGYREDGTGPVPPYLEPGNWDALRTHADRVSIENRNLTDRLADLPAGSQTAYLLLDAQDWMTDAQLNALWAQITRTAAPGARVLFRTGGRADILPGRVGPGTLSRWQADPDRGAVLQANDRSAIYGNVHYYQLRA